MNKLMMVMMLVGTKAGMDVVNGNVDKRNQTTRWSLGWSCLDLDLFRKLY